MRLIATRFLGRRSTGIAPARIIKRVDSTHRAHAKALANDAKDFPAASNLKTLFVLYTACLLLQLGGVHGRRHAAIHAHEKNGTLRTHDTGRLEMRGRFVVFGGALSFDITIGGKSAAKLQQAPCDRIHAIKLLADDLGDPRLVHLERGGAVDGVCTHERNHSGTLLLRFAISGALLRFGIKVLGEALDVPLRER